jgi:selenocysteine lyase/cysteine desulfurase
MSPKSPSVIRASFPALVAHPTFTYGDNAGGSQILGDAIDRMREYLVNSNAQMGSDYLPASTERCMTLIQEHAAKLLGEGVLGSEVVFGASSSQNIENLARSLEWDVKAGDEVVVMVDHEANASPWKKLAGRRGATVKVWKARRLRDDNTYSVGYDIEDLLPLISEKTRIVAMTACSNILGTLLPVKENVQKVRAKAKEVGANLEICLDCVAYAPHAQMDVKTWDVDYAVFSFYKVYGPHTSAMYVRQHSLENSVQSAIHDFLSPAVDSIGYKLQPAGPGYEAAWASTAVAPYIESLTSEGTLSAGYKTMAAHDAELARIILEYLTADRQRARGVRVVGSEEPGPTRISTITFVVREGNNGEPARGSKWVIDEFDKRGKVSIAMAAQQNLTLIDWNTIWSFLCFLSNKQP